MPSFPSAAKFAIVIPLVQGTRRKYRNAARLTLPVTAQKWYGSFSSVIGSVISELKDNLQQTSDLRSEKKGAVTFDGRAPDTALVIALLLHA